MLEAAVAASPRDHRSRLLPRKNREGGCADRRRARRHGEDAYVPRAEAYVEVAHCRGHPRGLLISSRSSGGAWLSLSCCACARRILWRAKTKLRDKGSPTHGFYALPARARTDSCVTRGDAARDPC